MKVKINEVEKRKIENIQQNQIWQTFNWTDQEKETGLKLLNLEM